MFERPREAKTKRVSGVRSEERGVIQAALAGFALARITQRISGIASASIGAAARRALLHRLRGRRSRSDTVARFAGPLLRRSVSFRSRERKRRPLDKGKRRPRELIFRILWSRIVLLNPSLFALIHLLSPFPPRFPPLLLRHPTSSILLPRRRRRHCRRSPFPVRLGWPGVEQRSTLLLVPLLAYPCFLFVVIRKRVGSSSRIKINQFKFNYLFEHTGPRELTGAVDLIKHYKLSALHDFFCKRTLPSSISDTHYLRNVVGETEIRKGEGMELGQLFQSAPYLRETTAQIQQFDLEILGEAFQLRDTAPIELPSSKKGMPTISGKSNGDSKDKERKHRKHKDKDREKDKEHKKHKHRHKDRTKDKVKEKKKDKSGRHESGGDHSKKHHEKKRKHDGNEDSVDNHKHKKSKHKSLKIEEVGGSKVAS
ncbi:Mediator of RNA polymerase II transcription subunit [Musa troglodytarum]|uniref:Mediator of RNA polymerase II transcription subunit n=1 Tax=Musa troglodytarum TaxID=320322 RepID=A0A9E7GQ74_9LILI|nr:Mediator of RNA polymerase II transcription subunit [Musa troglodytarum]